MRLFSFHLIGEKESNRMAEKITIRVAFGQSAVSMGSIGRVGENISRQILFDCSSALTGRTNASIICAIKRPGDNAPYPGTLTHAEGTSVYKLVLTSAEVAVAGTVQFELRMVDGEEILKSAIYTGSVTSSMTGLADTPELPLPDALNRLEAAIEKAGQSSSTATSASVPMVYCWGDSLTEGVGGWDDDHFITAPYTNEIHYPHINLGCRGEDIQTIMARQGADPIVLTADITLPASKDEAVQIGTMTKPSTRWEGEGLTTKSGETVKPCTEHEAGINPCLVGGVECELYREVTDSYNNETTYTYMLRRLEDGDETVIPSGTEIETYAMRYYRNGYAIIWMGANGRTSSHQEYVQKIKQMVEYGQYRNYLVLLCREHNKQWVFDGEGYKGIKSLLTDEDGTCHLLYLPPELIRRGYLLAGLSYQGLDTSDWDTEDAILKAAPRLMAENSNVSFGYESLHFSKWGYRAIGKLADEAIGKLINATSDNESGDADTPDTPVMPTEDEYGTLRYKLTKPVTFKGATYLDTKVKLYENKDADDWCVCICYSGTPTCADGLPIMLCECYKDGGGNGFMIRQSGEDEGWTMYGGRGALRFDKAIDYTGKTYDQIVNAGGKNVIIVSKKGTNYSFFMNGVKAYNSALGYALDEEKYIPTDMSLIFAGRHAGGSDAKVNYLSAFVLEDARVYNAALDDNSVALLTDELLG